MKPYKVYQTKSEKVIMGMQEILYLDEIFPNLKNLNSVDRQEFKELVAIVQNISGIQHIASNGIIATSKECKPFCERMRYLLIKEDVMREDVDVQGYILNAIRK